jgi:hypothetical protein
MSKKYEVYECEGCHKEIVIDIDKCKNKKTGLVHIEMRASGWIGKKYYQANNYYPYMIHINVCEECLMKMGYVSKDESGETKVDLSTAEQIYELITQIVNENLPN